jgi:hypothetical protein
MNDFDCNDRMMDSRAKFRFAPFVGTECSFKLHGRRDPFIQRNVGQALTVILEAKLERADPSNHGSMLEKP